MPSSLNEGYRVAICEQVEDPKEVKGIVRREVTRVITPGVTLEDGLLDAKGNNLVASLIWNAWIGGIAYMDVTTGSSG